MATTFKDFSAKKGIIAEGGDITVKGGNSVVFQATDNGIVNVRAPSGISGGEYTLVLPTNDGNANDFLKSDGSGNLSWASLGDIGGGTVTSVSATVPTGLTVDGVPITGSGTIEIDLDEGYVIPTIAELSAKLELPDLSVTVETASGGGNLEYSNTTGVFTYTPPDLSGYLTSETPDVVTTLTADSVNQKLVYTDESGTANDVDLSWAVDDTNLARITSGTVDANTGVATFTRDDATEFTVDFSALFDDTNLTRITSGSVTGSTLKLTRSDSTEVDVDVSSLLDDTDTTYSIALSDGGAGEVDIDLTAGGSGSGTDTVTLKQGANVSLSRSGDVVTISSTDTNTTEVILDTTPELGGDLDVNGKTIISASQNDEQAGWMYGTHLAIKAGNTVNTDTSTGSASGGRVFIESGSATIGEGSTGIVLDGFVSIEGIKYPKVDGEAGQVLTTDGAGWLSFADVATSNDFLTGLTFSDGVLTATVSNQSDVTVNLDGRYLQGYTETDTLDSVTGRGATTTNDIGTGAITINSAAKLDASTVTAIAVNSVSFPDTAIGAKVLLGIDDGSNKYVSELVVSHNGTDVSIAEYGQVIVGSELSFTLSGTISGGNVTISVDAGGPVKSSLSVLALL
jgi:hypothetical protein